MTIKGPKNIWAEPEIDIRGFSHFTEVIYKLKQHYFQDLILFRGQNCDKPLLPKLGREEITSKVSDIKNFELDLFDDFKKRYVAYSHKQFDNEWDLLALAQHFNLPTRLLDWSASALVALYFAVEKDNSADCGIVWVMVPEDKHIITSEEKKNTLFDRTTTKVFSPNHISERITAQQGWFTCHVIKTDGKIARLEAIRKYKTILQRLRIQPSYFPEMRVMLDTMGINSNTVYPDLVGLSKYLTWKHLNEDASVMEIL